MNIKVGKNGAMSEWIQCKSVKDIEQVKKQNPESIIIRVDDFYRQSSENAIEAEVNLEVFLALAYDFKKTADTQRKATTVHIDGCLLESVLESRTLYCSSISLEEQYEMIESASEIHKVEKQLSDSQRKRWKMYFYDGYTLSEIAEYEHVSKIAVHYTIQAVKRKLKKFLETT